MKKSTIIQIIIIIALAIILGVLLKFTLDTANRNYLPQSSNQGMGEPSGGMPEQMGNNSSSIEYSSSTEVTKDTTIESGEYSSDTAD
jgi:uncharacterized protein YxeA